MKKPISILLCLLPVALSWQFPGYPDLDCPTVREKMINDPNNQWMIVKCNEDGTFQDLQCYDQYPNVPDTCMCCAPDGLTLTLPGFGLDIKSCVCPMAWYKIYQHDPNAEDLNCDKNGFFAPLQCDDKTKECWCVDKMGNVLVPPSTEVHSCENNV